MWSFISGGSINSCYTTCYDAGTKINSAVIYNPSINDGIKITMSNTKLTDPYSVIGVDVIYAQINNVQLRLNLNDQITKTISQAAFTIYEQIKKLSCYGNVYQFQKASIKLNTPINTSTFFFSLDQNTQPFYLKKIIIWTNCCQNCQNCESSTTCLVCMPGFKQYLFNPGKRVCEQTLGCVTSNCYTCSQYGGQEVCTQCQPNFYLDGSGLCQENQPGSTCVSSTKYVDFSTSVCKNYNNKCWYEYPQTNIWTIGGTKEVYTNDKCPYNKQVIKYHYENYSIFQCSCYIQNCQICPVQNGCTSCYPGFVYDSVTLTCNSICGANQYYNTGSNSCLNCGTNCSTCDSNGCITCVNNNFYVSIASPHNCNTCSIPFCSICFGDGTCSICQNGYQISFDRTVCSVQCQVYNCQTCNISNGSICQTCITNFLLSADQTSCSCQVTNCNICQAGDGLKCDTCVSGYNLNALTFQCDCAVQNCQSCDPGDGTICSTCVSNYLLSINQQLCSCQVNNCTQCDYNDGMKCQTCQTGYILNTNTYQCDCTVANCQICNTLNGQICDSCITNYQLNASQDLCNCQVQNCKNCNGLNGNVCELCNSGYYLNTLKDKCSQCLVANCNNCLIDDNFKCNICNTGYSVNSQNLCELIIESNSYKVSIELNTTGYEIKIKFKDNLVNININDKILVIKLSILSYTQYSYEIRMSDVNQITAQIIATENIKNTQLQIDFESSKLIQDNKITDLVYNEDLPTFVIISQAQRQTAAQVAAITNGVSKSIISSFLPIAIFGNFYFLVNMIDLTAFLYYLMFLDIRFPINVTEFYGLFKDFQFPFIPNFFLYIISPNYKQTSPKKFMDMGVDSYLINNSGSTMTISFFVIALYIIVKVAHKTIPIRRLHCYLNRIIYETWEYGAFFDMMSAVYIYILMGCLLQTLNFSTDDKSSYLINYILYTIWMPICLLGPFIMIIFLMKQKNLKSNERLQQKVSSFISGLRIEDEDPYQAQNQKQNKQFNQEENKQNNEDDLKIRNNQINLQENELNPINQEKKQQIFSSIIQELAEEQLGSPVKIEPQKIQVGKKLKRRKRLSVFQMGDQSQNSNNYNKYFKSITQSNMNIVARTIREKHVAKFSKLCSSILYIRKILFAIIVVFMYGYCFTQLILLCLLNVIILSYLIYIQPYDQKSENVKNGISEIILILIQICAFFFIEDDSSQSEDKRLKIGWIIVCLSAFVLLYNTIILTKDTLQSLYFSLKKLFQKHDELNKKQQENKKKKPMTTPYQESIFEDQNINKEIMAKDSQSTPDSNTMSQGFNSNEILIRTRNRSSVSNITTNQKNLLNNSFTNNHQLIKNENQNLENKQQEMHLDKYTNYKQNDKAFQCFKDFNNSFENISSNNSQKKIVENDQNIKSLNQIRNKRSQLIQLDSLDRLSQKESNDLNVTSTSVKKQQQYIKNKKSTFSENNIMIKFMQDSLQEPIDRNQDEIEKQQDDYGI